MAISLSLTLLDGSWSGRCGGEGGEGRPDRCWWAGRGWDGVAPGHLGGGGGGVHDVCHHLLAGPPLGHRGSGRPGHRLQGDPVTGGGQELAVVTRGHRHLAAAAQLSCEPQTQDQVSGRVDVIICIIDEVTRTSLLS